jgi:tRNA-binding protein
VKPETDYAQFDALDIRVGRVQRVEVAASRKPTYRMTIDFGPDVGVKVSCGAFRNYAAETLVGRLVVAIVNFPVKKMGPERSEVLVLGVPDGDVGTIHLTTASPVDPGSPVY